MRIGAIADDFTGATDVAVAFGDAGLRVEVVFGVPNAETVAPNCDVVVIALKSRTIPAPDAVEQSLVAARWARSQGCRQIYFKYCSTFDSTAAGNIGPVADALSDELGAKSVVVTPAAPRHHRTVYQGHLFVGRQLLSESPMKSHPLTPMTDSDLLRVLATQSTRKIDLLEHEIVRRGSAAISGEIERFRAHGSQYVIVDALTDHDLEELGSTLRDQPLVTGAAGLAAGIARAMMRGGPEHENRQSQPIPPIDDFVSAAALAGSCSARTLEQIAAFSRTNPSHQLDPITTPDSGALAHAALDWFAAARTRGVPLIYSSADAASVLRAQQALGAERLAIVIEDAMARIAVGLIDAGIDRLVVAGGETSGSVATALGMRTASVGPEAAPGVPWLFTSLGGRSRALLLKSGNFGDRDFLLETASPTSVTSVAHKEGSGPR